MKNQNEAEIGNLQQSDVMCRFYIKLRKASSTTNDNGRWWIALDYAWCKKRGSIVVLQGKIGNGDTGDTGDRVCR